MGNPGVYLYLTMLRHLLILPLCLWLTVASAVNLDSLWSVWNDSTQSDTNRLKVINEISRKGYMQSNIDSAFYCSQIQYDFAESVGNNSHMAKALATQGVLNYNRGNYKEALECFHRSLENFKENNDKIGISSCYNNIGLVYWQNGNYSESLKYYQKSFKINKENEDKSGMAICYNNIGLIYDEQGDYKKSIRYFQKSLEISKATSDKARMATSYTNIGMIFSENKNYNEALDFYNKSLELKKEIGDNYGISACYNNIGLVYWSDGNYKEALQYFQKSLNIRKELGDKYGLASCYTNIGNILGDKGNYIKSLEYYQLSVDIFQEIGNKKGLATTYINMMVGFENQGNYYTAIDEGNKALSIAKEIGNVQLIKDASENLWKLHKKLEKYQQALEIHELYIEMRDSVNSIENREATIKLEYKHQYEKEQAMADAKHQEQMALSAEREKRQELIAYSAGGGLIMVLLFAFFIFNRLQVTRRHKTIIEQQKELAEEQKKDITDSIQYAENIQRALLPTTRNLKEALPDGFVLFQPKDIVSGDFYWMQHHNDRVYLAACDCTGHGVPGAFMSMIGSSLLDEAVVEKGITQPNEIFFEVRKGFINALKQTGETQKDGMDAVLIVWDKQSTLQVAAAYSPVLIIKAGEMKELKPDRQPVGFHTGEQKPFTHHEHKLNKGDTVYLFSDGYPDQFGGPKDKKFMMKNFKKLLLSIQDKTMNEQKAILEETMAEWKGDSEQVDDILVMGVRF